MWIKRREIYLAVTLSLALTIFAIYSNVKNEQDYSYGGFSAEEQLRSTYGLEKSSTIEGQQYFKRVSETIEGELYKGTFENVVVKLETLTDEVEGFVKSLSMIYKDEVWTGTMICKVPPTNVTFFTFHAREIIDANGTVTFISINIESANASQQSQEDLYSTINLLLKEVAPKNGTNTIIASIAPILSILTTGLIWIAEGLIIGIPMCLVSLGIVIFFNRAIIPLWKNTLKRPKTISENLGKGVE